MAKAQVILGTKMCSLSKRSTSGIVHTIAMSCRTPDRPGVPQRPGSTGADDIATESTAIPYRTIGVAAVAIVAVVFVFSTSVSRRRHVLTCTMHTHRVPQRHGSTGADEAIPGGMRWHTGSTGCARPGSTGADDLALKLLVHRSSAKNRNNAMPSRDQFLETYGQHPLSRKRASILKNGETAQTRDHALRGDPSKVGTNPFQPASIATLPLW